jgi:hypothetical protein
MTRLPSSRLLAIAVGSLIGAAALLQTGTAEAGRGHFSGSARIGGSVHISGRFHGGGHYARPWGRSYWRPRVWVGGGSYWGPSYYYYPRSYYYYYPEAVPSYYPVAPQASAPGIVAVAAPVEQPLPILGIGVFAGGSSVQDKQESSDLGALLRLRLSGGLLVEGEIAKTSFKDNERVDRRLGVSLIYEIGARNSWAPYLLAGGGVQQADVDGSFTTTQDFGEVGVGLRWALSRNFHLTADVRAGRSKTIDSNQPLVVNDSARSVAPPSGRFDNEDTEDYTRGRIAAILYF